LYHSVSLEAYSCGVKPRWCVRCESGQMFFENAGACNDNVFFNKKKKCNSELKILWIHNRLGIICTAKLLKRIVNTNKKKKTKILFLRWKNNFFYFNFFFNQNPFNVITMLKFVWEFFTRIFVFLDKILS